MRKRAWPIAVALAFSVLPARAEYDPEKAIEWVEHETPQALLEKDLAAGRKLFFVYCGIGCDLRGVDRDTYELCYSRSATAEEMGGSTDNPRSLRHAAILEIAWPFARDYNALLAKRLDDLGSRECPLTGSPKEWLAPANEAVSRIDPAAEIWVVPLSSAPGVGPPASLATRLTTQSLWTDASPARICAALYKGGLRRHYSFQVDFGSGEPSVRFACENGEVAS